MASRYNVVLKSSLRLTRQVFTTPAAERSIAKATDASHIVVRRPVSGCEFKGLRPTRRP